MFDEQVIREAMAHAAGDYPLESCGLVAGGRYIPAVNTAEDPAEDFRISPAAWVAADWLGPVQAVIHSHPDGDDFPSRSDMLGQMSVGVAYGIVTVQGGRPSQPFFWGGETPVPPLVGRVFRHGVTDCYALARDWYRTERGIVLPEYARRNDWWEHDEDMFLDNFRAAGFEPVDGQPQPGDGLLMRVLTDRVNHCGVYVGDGDILHHLFNRLSRHEPFNRWRRHIHMIVRRVSA
jgi:proteasome lid subunit RPN8/RPN11